MGAAVEDVHHRDGKDLCVWPAEVLEEGQPDLRGGGVGGGQRDGEEGVGAELRFVRRAIEGDHGLVDGDLVEGVEAGEFLGDDFFDAGDGLGHALCRSSGP